MCGIIGAVAQRDVSQILLNGLRSLEYRGYDSAGIAVIDHQGQLQRLRVLGKVKILAAAMQEQEIIGNIGIAHTRWATHGRPSEQNAHPQISHEQIALVHNGIIENNEILRQKLSKLGYYFTSDTDSEVAVHLIHYYYQQHEDLLRAVQEAAQEMTGAFSLGVIHKLNPHKLAAVRKGSPLVIGLAKNEQFIASDPIALGQIADTIIYLEEGDTAILTEFNIAIFNAQYQPVTRPSHKINLDSQLNVSKGMYRHFMLKEIFDQQQVLAETLMGRSNDQTTMQASFGPAADLIFKKVKRVHIIACGTSYHAGLIARYWIETMAGLLTQVEIASEYRYRDIVVAEDTLFVVISQSGETADSLAALNKAKSLGYLATLSICNIATSSLVRETELVFLTRAGIEVGVASTKAFTTQLVALLVLTVALSRDLQQINQVIAELQELPACCAKVLEMNKEIEELAASFIHKTHALFLGRGVHYPVAMEGALKLKEISYIHAEAYPAGELKHGPLALVDQDMPVIAIAPNNELLDKLKSNLQEVSARGGQLFVFVDDAKIWDSQTVHFIRVPTCGKWIAPIIYTIPLQLLAYHVAVAKGTDIDQPRNLAKSVTVE